MKLVVQLHGSAGQHGMEVRLGDEARSGHRTAEGGRVLRSDKARAGIIIDLDGRAAPQEQHRRLTGQHEAHHRLQVGRP